MQKVTIIGLGLIGGSIGMALRDWSKQNQNALQITGYDANMDRQSLAKSKGAVDSTTWSLPDAVEGADVIIVATPVGAFRQLFDDIAPHLKHGAIITDTGSTKRNVLDWAASLPDHVSFVGGHPMAGRSESLEGASADLFTHATWMVCPAPSADEHAIQNVMGLIAACGAEAFFVDPDEHDAYVGGISHLPFVVAAALVQTATSDPSWRDMKTLAATGFRDTTRVALGSPEMHRDIALTNRTSLIRWIDQMSTELDRFRVMLAQDDEAAASEDVLAYFSTAQDARALAEKVPARGAELDGGDTASISAGIGSSMSRMFLGGFGRKRDAGKKR